MLTFMDVQHQHILTNGKIYDDYKLDVLAALESSKNFEFVDEIKRIRSQMEQGLGHWTVEKLRTSVQVLKYCTIMQ